MIGSWLRRVLLALLISMGIGLAIGTWLRITVLEAERGTRYIGSAPSPQPPFASGAPSELPA